jgi:hypothetical protein
MSVEAASDNLKIGFANLVGAETHADVDRARAQIDDALKALAAAAREEGARDALTFARDRMYGKNAAPVTPRLEDWLTCFAEWSNERRGAQ